MSGCQHAPPNLPTGAPAYEIISIPEANQPATPYRISPLDTLSIMVFRENELSQPDVQVDTGGFISVPLVGQVQAKGLTANELSALITSRLKGRYLERPQVTVTIKLAASQTVTVLGTVTEPGIYPLRGPSTLLDALALAKGTTRIAQLREVVVFRVIDGKRMGALFDVGMIQRGEAEDPRIEGGDTVVVGVNHLEAAWRDVLLAAPLLSVFVRPAY